MHTSASKSYRADKRTAVPAFPVGRMAGRARLDGVDDLYVCKRAVVRTVLVPLWLPQGLRRLHCDLLVLFLVAERFKQKKRLSPVRFPGPACDSRLSSAQSSHAASLGLRLTQMHDRNAYRPVLRQDSG